MLNMNLFDVKLHDIYHMTISIGSNWTCSNRDAFDEVDWSRGASATPITSRPANIHMHSTSRSMPLTSILTIYSPNGSLVPSVCMQCPQENCHVCWLAGEHGSHGVLKDCAVAVTCAPLCSCRQGRMIILNEIEVSFGGRRMKFKLIKDSL